MAKNAITACTVMLYVLIASSELLGGESNHSACRGRQCLSTESLGDIVNLLQVKIKQSSPARPSSPPGPPTAGFLQRTIKRSSPARSYARSSHPPDFATKFAGQLNLIEHTAFGPEVEYHGMLLLPAASIPDSGSLGKTDQLAEGYSYPLLDLHIDHQPSSHKPIVEAVFGPVAVSREGFGLFKDSNHHFLQELESIHSHGKKPWHDVISKLGTDIFHKADAITPATSTQVANIGDIEVGAEDRDALRQKTYMQINMQVALHRVIDLWHVSCRMDSRIVGYAAVIAAGEFIKDHGTTDCPEFHGFLSQVLIYVFFNKAPYGSQPKNLVGVLVKATLQQQLLATMYEGGTTWKGSKKVAVPAGKVTPSDFGHWVEHFEDKKHDIIDHFFTTIKEILDARDDEEQRKHYHNVFDQQSTIEWVKDLATHYTGKAKDPADVKVFWDSESVLQLKTMFSEHSRDDAKQTVLHEFEEVWQDVMEGNKHCDNTGKTLNEKVSTIAGAPVKPFWLDATKTFAVIGETRTDSARSRDLPIVFLDDEDEFLSILAYFSGAFNL